MFGFPAYQADAVAVGSAQSRACTAPGYPRRAGRPGPEAPPARSPRHRPTSNGRTGTIQVCRAPRRTRYHQPSPTEPDVSRPTNAHDAQRGLRQGVVDRSPQAAHRRGGRRLGGSVAPSCAVVEPAVTRSSALSAVTRSRELRADAAAVARTEGPSSVTERGGPCRLRSDRHPFGLACRSLAAALSAGFVLLPPLGVVFGPLSAPIA
jgi:hypothetical protein